MRNQGDDNLRPPSLRCTKLHEADQVRRRKTKPPPLPPLRISMSHSRQPHARAPAQYKATSCLFLATCLLGSLAPPHCAARQTLPKRPISLRRRKTNPLSLRRLVHDRLRALRHVRRLASPLHLHPLQRHPELTV